MEIQYRNSQSEEAMLNSIFWYTDIYQEIESLQERKVRSGVSTTRPTSGKQMPLTATIQQHR